MHDCDNIPLRFVSLTFTDPLKMLLILSYTIDFTIKRARNKQTWIQCVSIYFLSENTEKIVLRA